MRRCKTGVSEQGVSSIEECALPCVLLVKTRKLFDDVYIPIVHMKKKTLILGDASMKRTREKKLRTVIGGA